MLAARNHVILKVDSSQKDEFIIAGKKFSTGRRYSENNREKNPVLALVVNGLGEVKKGMILVCNYSMFDWTSANYIGDDLFSVPLDEEIFAWVDDQGELHPINGNLLVERIQKKSSFELPDDYKKNYWDRGIISQDGYGYKKGDEVLWLKMADYTIVYSWDGMEKSSVKVHNKEIVGIFKK